MDLHVGLVLALHTASTHERGNDRRANREEMVRPLRFFCISPTLPAFEASNVTESLEASEKTNILHHRKCSRSIGLLYTEINGVGFNVLVTSFPCVLGFALRPLLCHLGYLSCKYPLAYRIFWCNAQVRVDHNDRVKLPRLLAATPLRAPKAHHE